MKKFVAPVTALVALLAVVFAPVAEARGAGRFGDEQTIHDIQPLVIPPGVAEADVLPAEWLQGAELGYMVTTHWFGAGLYLSKDGYVIHQNGSDDYWSLDADAITELQTLGVLPDPLPAFEPEVIDYVFGYSLWIVLAALAIWYGGRAILKRKPAPVVEASTAEPSA